MQIPLSNIQLRIEQRTKTPTRNVSNKTGTEDLNKKYEYHTKNYLLLDRLWLPISWTTTYEKEAYRAITLTVQDVTNQNHLPINDWNHKSNTPRFRENQRPVLC